MNPIAIDAFFHFHFLSSLTISPEGDSAVFVDKTPNGKENSYASTLKLLHFPAEGPLEASRLISLTSLGKENQFIYDDNDTLLLPLNRRKEDEAEKHQEKTAFYRLSLHGGEAQPAFSIPHSVASIKKVREGLYVFSSEKDLNRPDYSIKSEDLTEEEKTLREDYEDYHVLEELPYWTDNGGFISRFRTHLYLYEEATATVTELTPEPLFDLRSFDVQGDTIYYTGASYEDVRAHRSGLYAYQVNTGKTLTLIPEHTRFLGYIAPDEDGLYLTMKPESATSYWGLDHLYYLSKTTWENPQPILVDDALPEVGDAPMSDMAMGYTPAFKVRGGILYYSALIRTKAKLYTVQCERDEAGETGFHFTTTEVPLPEDLLLHQYDICKGRLLTIGTREGTLQEVYAPVDDGSAMVPLTALNASALADTYIAPCRYAGFTRSTPEGEVTVDGWFLEPIDYDPSKTYPGILDIHGGPRGAYGTGLFHEMQYWAGQGYFVLFCNPRGSSGRGDGFADIRRKYGSIDYQDIMAFVDHVLEAMPALDREHLGVTGGSYGGWMTNWIIGHTDRFKAAATQRSFSNWLSDFSASEIGSSFDVEEVGALPWEEPERLWWNSPAAYVDKIVTPTLFIHSLLDHNCPLSESMQIFAAMRYRHIPARACLFEGEGHGLSRGGKPRHRVRRIREITEWMNKYLKA